MEIKKFAVEKLESFGSFDYTLNILKDLDAKARAEVQSLGGNPHLSQLLDFLKIV